MQTLNLLFCSLYLFIYFKIWCHTAECTPEEAFSIVGDNIIFASGSPFKDVDLGMCAGDFVGYFMQFSRVKSLSIGT